MLTRAKIIQAITGAVLALGVVMLSGCGFSKIVEPYNDAPVSGQIHGSAEVGSMPDGFNNFAEKCDNHGNRVFVIFHGDKGYGSVFAMKDPTCKTGN